MEVSDGMVKGVIWFAVIVASLTIGTIVGGPIFALYTLLKGWDNTGMLIKLAAFVLPLVFVGVFFFNTEYIDPAQGSQLWVVWAIASPVLTYALLLFAYSRRDQMFNV